MGRSEAAQLRRAERRGRAVEEQAELDRASRKLNRKKRKQEKKLEKPERSAKEKQKPAPSDKPAKRKAAESSFHKAAAKRAAGESSAPKAAAKRKATESLAPGAGAWENSVATPDKIESNKRLRLSMRTAPEKLTAEERDRGAALLARDEKKREKKEQLRADKAVRTRRNLQSHANRQLERQKQARVLKSSRKRDRRKADPPSGDGASPSASTSSAKAKPESRTKKPSRAGKAEPQKEKAPKGANA